MTDNKKVDCEQVIKDFISGLYHYREGEYVYIYNGRNGDELYYQNINPFLEDDGYIIDVDSPPSGINGKTIPPEHRMCFEKVYTSDP